MAVYADTVKAAATNPKDLRYVQAKLPDEKRLVTLGPADSFIAFMEIWMPEGLITCSPWVFCQLWVFVAAGLYAHERKCIMTTISFSVGLSIFGALFFLFIAAPLSLRFFLVSGDFIGVWASWTFQKYVPFVTMLMLVFGLAFQTSIAFRILNRTGFLSIQVLKKSRKYVFLTASIVGAVTTPPDVMSRVTLVLPPYALFELGIMISHLSHSRRSMGASAK